MALPEPTPPLEGEKATRFSKRLKSFKLSPAQKEFFRGAKASFEKSKRRG